MELNLPHINMDTTKEKMTEFIGTAKSRIKDPTTQRRFVLVIVCIALLLDNMLYMVIVPIIPDYLRSIGAWDSVEATYPPDYDNSTNATLTPMSVVYKNEDIAIGVLFASKAIVQLMVSPFSGTLIDKIGYDIPLMIGLSVMFVATTLFAFGQTYGMLMMARSLQGVGSAFADTSGLGMIADRFPAEEGRSQALGIALAFISFGCLVAPPFGGVLYEFVGKKMPFMTLALISLGDGLLLLFVIKPYEGRRWQMPKGTPIYKLILDPYIAVAAGALSMSNIALAFLEPTIAIWMEDTMSAVSWQTGIIWLPAFFPHVFGVVLTVKLAGRYPQYQWIMAAIGLILIGLSTIIVPFCNTFTALIAPLCGVCFGIALVDTALLPLLGYLVDVRHVPVYGSIYAIADISYSLAYAIGPILAGQIVFAVGFTNLNVIIAVFSAAYAPMLFFLRRVYDFQPMSNEDTTLLTDEPATGLYDSLKAQQAKGGEGDQYFTNHNAFKMGQMNGSAGTDGYGTGQKAPGGPGYMSNTTTSQSEGVSRAADLHIRKAIAHQQDYSSLSEQEDSD